MIKPICIYYILKRKICFLYARVSNKKKMNSANNSYVFMDKIQPSPQKKKPTNQNKTKNLTATWRFWWLSKDRQILERSLNLEQVTKRSEFLIFCNFDPMTVVTHRHSYGCTRMPQTVTESPLSFWMEELQEVDWSNMARCWRVRGNPRRGEEIP